MLSSLARGATALRLAAVFAAALSIAACSSTPDQLADASGAGGAGGRGFGAGGAATPGSAQDFVVNVGDRVFFESDSSDLTPTATATLDRQAEWLQRYPRHSFLIEGHADERGTREYNFSLGARRAQTVRDYLASRGIPSSRMRTVSYGKERPVAVCNDISCWSQNRRAVTVIGGAGES
ncbi:peptidoglycan-associated lipoprotein Pal [Enterovirga aerilata]|uniref:Peptidoglycan-associated lipoprotein n=1 Tax=Enterovirga aerilata TaxID=2730920 RepID=A0A849IE98_9HYPH|nr:peptidoglycan-associated lipoprotein Pal [Enterovirga sp. DB1703]NNM74297.1 peptidoglycan-associated lipoprotein Pal [Enterovirga sp. DB1703]